MELSEEQKKVVKAMREQRIANRKKAYESAKRKRKANGEIK